MITKVGYQLKEGGVIVTINTADDDGSVHKSDFTDSPRPEFYQALQKLCPYIFSSILGIEPNWPTRNPTAVRAVNFKAKDDVTLVTVTLKAELYEGSEWTINTPQFCLETQNEQLAEMLIDVRTEAELYLGGNRAQLSLV